MKTAGDHGIHVFSHKEDEAPRNIDICGPNEREHFHIKPVEWTRVSTAILKCFNSENPSMCVSTISKNYTSRMFFADYDGDTPVDPDHVCQFIHAQLKEKIPPAAFRKWISTCIIGQRADNHTRLHFHWGALYTTENRALELTYALQDKWPDFDIQTIKNGSIRAIFSPKCIRCNGRWALADPISAYIPRYIWSVASGLSPFESQSLGAATDHFCTHAKSVGPELAAINWSLVGIPADIADSTWGIYELTNGRKRKDTPIIIDEQDEDDPMYGFDPNSLLDAFDLQDHSTDTSDLWSGITTLLEEEPRGSPRLITFLCQRLAIVASNVYLKDPTGLIKDVSINAYNFRPQDRVGRPSFKAKRDMDLKEFWLAYAPRYNSDIFIPNGPPCIAGTKLNTWQGLRCQFLQPEITSENMRQVRFIIWASWVRLFSCNTEVCSAFWQWIAFMCQHPDMKTQKAFVFYSMEGCGKSDLLRKIRETVFGDVNTFVSANPQDFCGSFNYWTTSIFVEAAEALFIDKQSNNRIKALITDEKCTVNRKFQNVMSSQNYANFACTTNHLDCLQLDLGQNAGRRFICPDVNEEWFLLTDEQQAEHGFTLQKWEDAWKDAGDVLAWLLYNKVVAPPPSSFHMPMLRTKARRLIRDESRSALQNMYKSWLIQGANRFSYHKVDDGDLVANGMGWYASVPVLDVLNYAKKMRIAGREKLVEALASYGVRTDGKDLIFPSIYDPNNVFQYEKDKDFMQNQNLIDFAHDRHPHSPNVVYDDIVAFINVVNVYEARMEFCKVEPDFTPEMLDPSWREPPAPIFGMYSTEGLGMWKRFVSFSHANDPNKG